MIKINPNDNVSVLLNEQNGIKSGHKVALCDIKKGESIIKYGCSIGVAKEDIKKGDHIHIHNLKTGLSGKIEYKYEPDFTELPKNEPLKFKGFLRENGKVGVRNEVWIIPTVGCVNGIASRLAEIGKKLIKGSVDEVVAFPHSYGCSQLGDDQENTRKILANLVNHPNAGAVLVLGLGCENSGIEILKDYIGEYDTKRVKFLKVQDSEDEITDGTDILTRLIDNASIYERSDVSSERLIVGLKCGGSDGFSGISANPVVGIFSDMLVSHGGTSILTEVPEMFGAEQILMNRCANKELFEKTVKLINNFKEYYEKSGMPIYENPSPGNKDGGISTLEDKSLGCTQKSGTSKVCGVLEYGEIVTCTGLNLLSAPGNDLVAATALAAAGAQIILFTTGRGTPFASPVPTVKISSNTKLSQKKNNWIDFNAGLAVDESKMSIVDLGESLFDLVLKVAEGDKVKSELSGYHDMAIFKTGVTL